MATRKQRRRREKEQRHDYEFVYVDSEGNEVEPDEVPADPPARRSGSANGKAAAKGSKRAGGRARRAPQPPSWRRVLKRGAIFAPLFIATVLLIGGKHMRTSAAIFQAVILLVFFVPFSYFLDSMVWRSYQKKLGRETAAKK
ncbi:MAG: hypothetical protein E6G14_10075 [Actinobacteria bacterium]|nr:MAG: hypothetical protein E6G14_10075 [Actinomycetota bacterium]